jgi:hypothetical protein
MKLAMQIKDSSYSYSNFTSVVMHVAFTENALFKSYGVIFWSCRLPRSLASFHKIKETRQYSANSFQLNQ